MDAKALQNWLQLYDLGTFDILEASWPAGVEIGDYTRTRAVTISYLYRFGFRSLVIACDFIFS